MTEIDETGETEVPHEVAHQRIGIMANQAPGERDLTQPVAEIVVCDDEQCQDNARQWVAANSHGYGEPTLYLDNPDPAF